MKKLLVKALENRFKMSTEDAKELAKTVVNIFDGAEEVEDMSIDKYVRQLFYELQREKLLKVRREEIKEQGKIIRKFFWSFDNEMIKEAAKMLSEKEDIYHIYNKIPKEAWLSHVANN